jgi:membrane-associated protein
MIDAVLALVPDYGLLLVFLVVVLACVAIPVPASMLVLTAGSFAAVGDLALVSVVLTTFVAFLVGDQIAFLIARKLGPRLIEPMTKSSRIAPVLARSQTLLHKRGKAAVLLSHTVLSPTCPYVTCLSGAGGLSWRAFSLAAVPGAMIWSVGYTSLGYLFATQLEQVAEILGDFFGLILAVAMAFGALVLLKSRWDKARATGSDASR